MKDILYYPLIDCDMEGNSKTPMIPTLSLKSVKLQSRMWLEEIVPHYYRLTIAENHNSNDSFTIRCPMCGTAMKCIGGNINETKRGLYACNSCNKN